MKKRIIAIFLAAVLCLSLAACGPKESVDPQNPDGPQTGEVKKSSKDTLTIAVAGDIPSLKGGQNSRTTASLCWPTLFTLNETAEGGYEYVIDEYSAAESAEWSEDQKSLDVYKRQTSKISSRRGLQVRERASIRLVRLARVTSVTSSPVQR